MIVVGIFVSAEVRTDTQIQRSLIPKEPLILIIAPRWKAGEEN
jgi:hypothetical protein